MIEEISIYIPPEEAPVCKVSKGSRAERLNARERYKRSLCAQAQAQRIMYSVDTITQQYAVEDHDPDYCEKVV